MPPGMVMYVNRDQARRTEGNPARAVTNTEDSMAMPADMDMGFDDSAAGTDTATNVTAGTLTFTSEQPDVITELLVPEQKPVTHKSAVPNHSRTISSCTHETCSQISASIFPPKAQHCGHDALCSAASIVSSLNVRTDFHWIRPGTPPPLIATVVDLATILRV